MKKPAPAKDQIPPEAAAIMARMVKMPPKPHEDMKIGKPKQEAKRRESAPQKTQSTSREKIK